MNLFKYKVTRQFYGPAQILSEIFTIEEIEKGDAEKWLKEIKYVSLLDELQRLPYVTDDRNGDKVFAGDKVKWENSTYPQIYEVRKISGGYEIASLPYSDEEPRTTFPLTAFYQDIELLKDKDE